MASKNHTLDTRAPIPLPIMPVSILPVGKSIYSTFTTHSFTTGSMHLAPISFQFLGTNSSNAPFTLSPQVCNKGFYGKTNKQNR